MTKHLHNFKENLIYVILWTTLFLAPILSQYIRIQHDTDLSFTWDEIFFVWRIYAAYLIVFLIHNFQLAPLLIQREKKTTYFLSTTTLIIFFVAFQFLTRPNFPHHPNIEKERFEKFENNRKFGPMPMPEMPPKFKDKKPVPPKFKEDKPKFIPFFLGGRELVSSIIVILLVGMNLGIKLYFRAEKRENDLRQLEQENLNTQLEYLKYQINPHFFMNTLNNIHALVDIDPEKAKTTILELSKMMRYLLYEGNRPCVAVNKEVDFLNNYIKLMKLRYTDKVRISFEHAEDIPNREIPPLLLINFVENAFKHGISYQEDSFIEIRLHAEDQRFCFFCRNSMHQESTKEAGGVGLENVRKRLSLIYGHDYQLNLNNDGKVYEVHLSIPFCQKS